MISSPRQFKYLPKIKEGEVVSKELIYELKTILKDEFNLEPDENKLNSLANFLVNYFQLLLKINNQNEKAKFLKKESSY